MFGLLNETKGVPNARYFFIFGHPEIVYWFGIQFMTVDYDELFRLLVDTKSYGLQDEVNLISIEKYAGVKVPPHYFPIVVDDDLASRRFEYNDVVEKDRVNIVYMGRLDSDKVYTAVNLLDNLYDSLDGLKANVHIIGDGNSLRLISPDRYAPKITIYFNSFLFNEKRDDYIIRNADIAVAMGVSSLDVSVVGAPTVIPIVSKDYIRDDKYVYLFDTSNYNVGWESDNLRMIDCPKHHISEIIDDIMVKGLKSEYGRKSREFAINTFSLSNNIESMIGLIDGTELTNKKLLHNRTMKLQFFLFKLYRIITLGKGDYDQYLSFKHRVENVIKMPFIKMIKTTIRWGISKVRG